MGEIHQFLCTSFPDLHPLMIAKAKFDYTADPKYAQTMTIKADEILVDVEEIGDEMRGTSEISKEPRRAM